MGAAADPRVMHVILDLERGGAQEMVCVLAESRCSSARPFVVCALADGPQRRRLNSAGATVEIVPGPSCAFWQVPRYAAELERIGARLAALVERHQIDVIQTHLLAFLDLVVIRLRRPGRGPAVIWTFHGTDFLPARPGPTLRARRAACRWMYRRASARVDAVVCVSEDVRRAAGAVIGAADRKVHVIGNAPSALKLADARRAGAVRGALGIPPDAGVILFVGRLSAEKGCDRLIAAAPAVLSAAPATVFLVAGSGPEEAALHEQASRAGVADRVRFLGARDDVGDLLAAADVFCLPSRRDAMSLALLEAMAAGRAVVASDIAGNRQLVTAGRTGVLVRPDDDGALAAALLRLLARRDEAQAIAREARAEAMSRHSAASQYEDYQRLYREVSRPRIVA